MTRFRFSARRSADRLETGTVDAENRDAAVEVLHRRGLFPIDVKEDLTTAHRAWRWGRPRFGLEEQAVFFRQLGELLEASVPMADALELLRETTRERGTSVVLKELTSRIRRGDSLSAGLREIPHRVHPAVLGAVQAGEASGTLGRSLAGAADLLERDLTVIRRVREALTYPAIVAGASFVTLVALFTYLIPRMGALYDDLGQAMPVPTRVLLAVGEWGRALGPWLAAALLLSVAAIVTASRRMPSIRARWDALLLRLPWIGRILDHREMVQLTHRLATLIEARLPALDALEVTARASSRMAHARALRSAADRVRGGARLSEAFREEPRLAGPVVTLLTVGESASAVPDALRRAGRLHEVELETRLRRVLTWLEPALILGVGMLVALIVFAMLLPVFQVDALLR